MGRERTKTAEHDTATFLAGYEAGNLEGQTRTLALFDGLLGKGPMSDWVMLQVLRQLEIGGEK